MQKIHENPKRVMMKNPITMDSLVLDLGKVFTDEIEAYGDDHRPMDSLETNIVLNSGELAKVPSDAQRLLFLANQCRRRAEVLLVDIKEMITKFFEEEILKEGSEELRISKFSKFVEEGIEDIHEIQKLQAYKAREESFTNLAMLIISEHIGHDSTHAECSSGIGIRKGWQIVKLYSEDSNTRSEFNHLVKDVMRNSKTDLFEGLDDLIEE